MHSGHSYMMRSKGSSFLKMGGPAAHLALYTLWSRNRRTSTVSVWPCLCATICQFSNNMEIALWQHQWTTSPSFYSHLGSFITQCKREQETSLRTADRHLRLYNQNHSETKQSSYDTHDQMQMSEAPCEDASLDNKVMRLLTFDKCWWCWTGRFSHTEV